MSWPLDWNESEYRTEVQSLLNRIEAAFEGVDPDVAECEQSMGALTITLASGSRLILSMQPSVRQIWLALAARGTAYHFSPSENRPRVWLDDKGQRIELLDFLKTYFLETAAVDLAIGG